MLEMPNSPHLSIADDINRGRLVFLTSMRCVLPRRYNPHILLSVMGNRGLSLW